MAVTHQTIPLDTTPYHGSIFIKLGQKESLDGKEGRSYWLFDCRCNPDLTNKQINTIFSVFKEYRQYCNMAVIILFPKENIFATLTEEQITEKEEIIMIHKEMVKFTKDKTPTQRKSDLRVYSEFKKGSIIDYKSVLPSKADDALKGLLDVKNVLSFAVRERTDC